MANYMSLEVEAGSSVLLHLCMGNSDGAVALGGCSGSCKSLAAQKSFSVLSMSKWPFHAAGSPSGPHPRGAHR